MLNYMSHVNEIERARLARDALEGTDVHGDPKGFLGDSGRTRTGIDTTHLPTERCEGVEESSVAAAHVETSSVGQSRRDLPRVAGYALQEQAPLQ
jgi:hypothetical protein